jgi:GNAT superfamily N-acetyltransferase
MELERALSLQVQGLRAFARLMGSSAPGSHVLEPPGVVAAVVPVSPERSVLNSVVYEDADQLIAALGELDVAYTDAGIHAWTVWVPERDQKAAGALEHAGHTLDAQPRAMVLELDRFDPPDVGDLDWDAEASVGEVAALNEAAYGLPEGQFQNALASPPDDSALRLYRARVDGEIACVAATIDVEADSVVFLVATDKGHRGKRLAGRLLGAALADAHERGIATSTLQSTKLGRPVYERLGYEDHGALDMWERRWEDPPTE